MKPKFNTWYVTPIEEKEYSNGTTYLYHEEAIFWKVGNKWMAFTKTTHRPLGIATFWYDDSDFQLEDNEKIATEKDIVTYNLDVNKAKRDTIMNLLDPKRWEDD